MSSEFPNLRIFFLTVGESVSSQSLDAIKKHTNQPYKLTIWYDTCGRGVNWDLYKTFLSYTDDVVLLSKDHTPPHALGYALLYLDGDYIMHVPCDTVVTAGYLDRFSFAFSQLEKIACAGCVRVDDKPDYKPDYDFILNSKYFMPDGVLLFSREAINDLGGIATVFNGYGMEQREWAQRAIAKGWNVVSCSGIMKEIGSMHDGRNMNSNLDEEVKESVAAYLPIMASKWENFKWWKKENKIKNEVAA